MPHDDPLAPLLARMERTGVASPAELRGCTPEEIAVLEARYGVRLPATYRRYLEAMGHDSGRLFRHDHYWAAYTQALTLTGEHRELAEDPKECPLVLPEDALIVGERQGDVFAYIRCTDPRDSPVWWFDIYRWTPKESHPTVLAWLDSWCTEAEEAIAHGYFQANPGGTW